MKFHCWQQHLHVRQLDVQVLLFREFILLQEDDEFQLLGAVLSQHLVAGVWHLIPVLPVVEGGEGFTEHGALSWEQWRHTVSFRKTDIVVNE